MSKFSFKSQIWSFKYAFEGLKFMFQFEPKIYIHLAVQIVTVVLGFVLDIDRNEWFALILLLGVLFSAELFNTSIELICDYIQPERHNAIKTIKDVSSGAVLILSIVGVILAAMIFIPRLF